MLEFFRKYQRFFFLVVTTVIILSFSFFGTFTTFNNEVEVKDRTIGKGLNGTDLKLLELQRLARFLSTDAYDAPSQGNAPNFMNDGVIRKDFLSSGLAGLLVEEFFESLKDDFQTRLAQAKRYKLYSHPEAPFIGTQAVWSQFNPNMIGEFEALRGMEGVSASVFTRLANLYMQQSQMPPEFLRRILMYQMQQYSWVRPDPEIQYGDFALFGFNTVQDWFGNQFVDLAAQYVYNAASEAEKKGYKVSLAEAKADLVFNFERAMGQLKQHKQQPIAFDHQLRLIGMDEKGAVEAWQKVLLFRRYFNGIGDAVLIDSLPYRDLSEYAQESAVVQVYGLPEVLVLRTADDLFGLQFYLDAVAVSEKDVLALPTSYRSLDEVEKRVPEFVETVFRAQVKQVSKGELSLRASVRETLQWQLDHWDLLTKQFSKLSGSTREERFAALDRLDPAMRAQVDSWSRLKLVDGRPDWIEEAFFAAPAKEQVISVSSNRVNLSFVDDAKEFGKMLSGAAAGEEGAKMALAQYAGEHSALYRITDVEKISDRQIRTLEAVKKEGLLRELVNRQLEKHYVKIREKNPALYQTEKEEWRPFAEVKDKVGLDFYSDLRKAIDTKEKTEKKPIEFYVSHRLAEPMRKAARTIQETQKDPQLLDQFKLVRQEKKLHRTAQENWMNTEAFILVPNQWSPVHVPPNGQIVFFYLQEKIKPAEPILSQMEAGKEMISRDTKRVVAKRLLNRIRKEKAVVLPMQKEEDHV
ncbi:MAG: hypothetical protein JSS32_09705 [Verrucomicrobia bacterium]|nr:hypothetical protein [Verrucomicrobiota bacterium]